MAPCEDEIIWEETPQWDAQFHYWYWKGHKLEGGQLKLVTLNLRPDEVGADGYPRQDAFPPPRQDPFPPPPSQSFQQQPPHSFDTESRNLGDLSLYQGQQMMDYYLPSNEQRNVPGPSTSYPSVNQYHNGSLNQAKPNTSSSGRTHHKKSSDRKSSYPPPPLPQFEASFQQLSLQNAKPKDTKFFLEPVSNHGKRYDPGNTGQAIAPFNPDAALWYPGSGKGASHLTSTQGPTSSYNSSYGSKEPPQHYGAQVHQGARFAGGPALPPIRVKETAREKIKPVPQASKDLLDSNFHVYMSSDFQPGKIIKVWWSQPLGVPTRGVFGSRLSKPGTTLLSDHKKAIWTGFRRFIIIRNWEGHSYGVPIYTYGGQACTKHGVKCHEHGVIYEDSPGCTGDLLPNERPLGFPPIRARTTNGEPMKNTSRVNYTKIADIEHNVVVNFIAEVVPEDWEIAKEALKRSGLC